MRKAIVLLVVLGVAATASAVELSPIFKTFFWYQYNMSAYPSWYALSDTNGDSAFELGRLYVGANFKTDYRIEGRFLFDVGRDPVVEYGVETSADEEGNLTGIALTSSESAAPYRAYVKNAYLQYELWPYLKFRGGVIPASFSIDVTKAWRYRFVRQGPVDGTAGWESTADLGIDVFGAYDKWILYELTFTNGNGYTRREDDAGKALALMLKTYPVNMVDLLDGLSLTLYVRANTVSTDDNDNTLLFAGMFNWAEDFDFGLGFNLGFVSGMQIHKKDRGYSSDYAELGKLLKDNYDTSYKYNDPTADLLMSFFGEVSYSLKGVTVDYGRVALFGRYDVYDPNTRNDFDTYDDYVRDYKNETSFNPAIARAITGSQDEFSIMVVGVSYAYKRFRVALDYQSTVYAEYIDSDDKDNDLDSQKPADNFLYLHTEFSF